MRAQGAGGLIAIDDFGTGHSSLAYLKRFPVDYLKIDRSFSVRDLPNSIEDVAISKAIIALAKSLKRRVIAEGVDDGVRSLHLLEAHGCDEGQGYLISKPLAAAEAGVLLRSSTLSPTLRASFGRGLWVEKKDAFRIARQPSHAVLEKNSPVVNPGKRLASAP